MNGLTSNSAGVLIVSTSNGHEPNIIDLEACEAISPNVFLHNYSIVQDWTAIESTNENELIIKASLEFWIERTISLIQECISGHEAELEKEILEYVEDLLISKVLSASVLDGLLVAPLLKKHEVEILAKKALSYGLAGIASILDDLTELQPLILRFVTIWLNLNDEIFNSFSKTKEEVWLAIVKNAHLSKLINIDNHKAFILQLNNIAFYFKNPSDRICIQHIAKNLAQGLFPNQTNEENNLENLFKSKSEKSDKEYIVSQELSDYKTYKRVEKQIEAIISAISVGQDEKAIKFLNDLMQMQVNTQLDNTYVLKSLCNIAKKSADIFRFDFESICLKLAMDISDSDQWVLIQYANQLKRFGEYEKALVMLRKAERIEDSSVIKSSIADVYSQKGDFISALKNYKDIIDWDKTPTILTAIADINRRMGHFDEAEKSYESIIQKAKLGEKEFLESELRSNVGLAEILKQKGELVKASKIYKQVVNQCKDGIDLCHYNLGYCNVLKLMGSFDLAYEIIDDLIQKFPFALRAKFIRGSILGLRSKELEGLLDLPEIDSEIWKEWIGHYIKGLILLKLERFEESQNFLIELLSKVKTSNEEKGLLRMGAALCFIGKNNIKEAVEQLNNISENGSYFTKYISLVLKLHIATINKDKENIKSINLLLSKSVHSDTDLICAIKAIRAGDFVLAIKYEANALLKAA